MKEEPQRNLFESRADRDVALERVASNAGSFLTEGLGWIVLLYAGQEVTGEDIRAGLIARDCRPHHHNAWGALINYAVRHGVLVKTGRYRQMRARSSHARSTPVYRVKA